MKARISLLSPMVGLLIAVVVAPAAQAFFPAGGFDQSQNLIIPKWELSYLDANHDGDVSGDNEGVPITFETGSLGWNDDEVAAMKQSFETWESVPTAYIAFSYTDPLPNPPDPLETSADIGSIDAFNYVARDTEGALPSGVEGETYLTWAIESGSMYVNGAEVEVFAGQILDMDILITPAVRTMPKGTLAAGSMILIGYGIGLAPSPMNNISRVQIIAAGQSGDSSFALYESKVMEYRDTTGVLQRIGVTPTMFPMPVYYLPDRTPAPPAKRFGDYTVIGPLVPDALPTVSPKALRGLVSPESSLQTSGSGQGADSSRANSRGAGASRIFVDAQGHRVSPPPGTPLPPTSKAASTPVNAAPLQVEDSPVAGGGKFVRLDTRFTKYSVATVGADGKVHLDCLDAPPRNGVSPPRHVHSTRGKELAQ